MPCDGTRLGDAQHAARPAQNLRELLALQAQRDPESVAILAPGRAPLHFGELLDQIDHVGAALNERGLGRSHRVALVVSRGAEAAVAALSVASNAICVPLNATATLTEMERGLVQTAATALLVPATTGGEVKDLASRLGIPLLEYAVADDAAAGRFRVHASRSAPHPADAPPLPADIAFVLRTSGTSRAKIVPVSHGNIVARTVKSRILLELGPSDRCLNPMPLCYNHGLNSGLMLPLVAGCAVICPPVFDRETFLACMRAFSPTWYTASFTYHQAIFEWLEREPDALAGHRLRFVRAGSGPLPARVRAGLEEILGAPVLEIYGSTETGTIAANSPVGLRKPGMVGQRLNDDVAIMDAGGNIVGANVAGELVVRGATVFGGYENDPAANERAFRYGWYHTGDRAFIDEDGYIRLTGRLDDVINRGGEKIAPQEIDEALLAHESVAQAVSFPVPHPRLYQDIAAAVVPRAGAELTGQELRRFLTTRLAPYKVPHLILCIPELPIGPTGKIVRSGLASHFGLDAAEPRDSIAAIESMHRTDRAGAVHGAGVETIDPPIPTQPGVGSPRNLYEMLAAHARRDPNAAAILAPGRGPLHFGALIDRIDDIRRTLNASGLGRTDRIALLAGRGPETAVAALALASTAVCVPLNPTAIPADLESALVQTRAKALLVPVGEASAVKAVAARLDIALLEYTVADAAQAGSIRIHVGRPEPAGGRSDAAATADCAFVLRTSGTTARAKIVPISHGNLAARANKLRRILDLSPDDRCLNLMEFWNNHGLNPGLVSSLAAGCAVICPPAFDAATFLACMRECWPTWFTAGFTHHQAILDWLQEQPSALDGHRLRFVRAGSGPLPARVYEGLENILGVPVLETYSATEAGTIAGNTPSGQRKPGMVGQCLDDDIAIMDSGGNILAAGHEGELVVRGPTVFGGYENDPDANARAFRGGWYHTGDQAVIDADGYIKLSGRLDDVINRGGEKIAPAEIEAALLAHEAVAQAVTFPVPHPRLHQDVAAAVVPHDGAQVSGEELRRFLAERLAPFKVPRVIVCTAELPTSPAGKIGRAGLAAHFGLDVAPPAAYVEPLTKAQAALVALWRDVLKRPDLGCDDDFFQCGGDSLSAVELLRRIEGELQYRLPLSLLAEAPTVNQFAARLEKSAVGASDGIVAIHATGKQRPLFAVFGRYGHVVRLLPLLRSLGPDQPCYGLQPPGMDWSSVGCSTLPEMAAHYVRAIRRVQPQGPYRLLGVSFGGLVVFEMALQLQRAGEAVELLAIVDANPPGILFEGGIDITPSRVLDDAPTRVAEVHLTARRNYVLDSRLEQNHFRGEIAYFYCTGNPVLSGRDPRRLWQQFAPNRVRLLPLPGMHGGVDQEPQCAALQHYLRILSNGDQVAASDASSVFDRTYRIEKRSRGESIVCSTGEVHDVHPDRVQGHLEAVVANFETIQLRGWAVEPCQRQPAQTIVALLADRCLGYGATGALRPDVAKHLRTSSAQYAGFDFHLRREPGDSLLERPRLFVLSDDGVAAELRTGAEQQLLESQAKLASAQEESEKLRAELSDLTATLDAMKNSKSWLVTLPLRYLRQVVSRFR